MKKITLSLIILFITSFFACESKSMREDVTLVVGAPAVPHIEILEQAKPMLAERGIDLRIVNYQDYSLPNKHLMEGKLDLNYFQTSIHFEEIASDYDNQLKNIGSIHVERMGIYSQKYTDLSEIPDGTTLIMSSTTSDHGRILEMLQREGLIKLGESVETKHAELKDIVENPKNLQFKAETPIHMLGEAYQESEGDIVAINANYAIGVGLDPDEDALALEDIDNEYANIIVIRAEDADKKELQTLVEVLQSEEMQDFITELHGSAVMPAVLD